MLLPSLQNSLKSSSTSIKAGGLDQEGSADGQQPANDGCAGRALLAPFLPH